MDVSRNSIRSTSEEAWFAFSLYPTCCRMHLCKSLRIIFLVCVCGTDDAGSGVYRFKRVGPNAMKGRGIGTARGRATIMRGTCIIFCSYVMILIYYPSTANGSSLHHLKSPLSLLTQPSFQLVVVVASQRHEVSGDEGCKRVPSSAVTKTHFPPRVSISSPFPFRVNQYNICSHISTRWSSLCSHAITSLVYSAVCVECIVCNISRFFLALELRRPARRSRST